MIEGVMVFGICIFLGIAVIFIKLPKRISLRLLYHHIWVDVGVTIFTLWIHFGTITGLMSATVAGLCCSAATSSGKWCFGYIKRGRYYRGLIDLGA